MMKEDPYAHVTAKIIADLQKGQLRPRDPWSADNLAGYGMCPRHRLDMPYRGVNAILLWNAAAARGYGSPYWMTEREAATLGGSVRKGEEATHTIYGDTIIREKGASAPGQGTYAVQFIQSRLFNADQIEGLPERFQRVPDGFPPRADKRIEDEA